MAGVPPEREKWMSVKNAARHLEHPQHLQALELAENAGRIVERLRKEQEAESATNNLQDIQLTVQHFDGPVAGASSRVMSDAEAKMWDEYRANGADFSAGDEPEGPAARHRQLRDEAEIFGLWNPESMARKLGFGNPEIVSGDEEDKEDDFLAEIMGNVDLQPPEPAEIQNAGASPDVSNEWYPYPTKLMFLLDLLDNFPRMRVSSSLMRVFLWILKEAQCKDVPSFDHLRRIQKGLRTQCGIPSIPCKSVQGNVFFMNDPAAIIAKDWANPTTRKLIHVYPEIPEDGIICEIWHAQKWRKDMDLEILSPMFAAGVSHYYVNEVARVRDGNLVIPIRWVKFRDKIYADTFSVIFNEQGEATIADKIPKWAASTVDAGYPARMPNPKRVIAAGRPMYCSFVNYFGDDNLPRKLLQQEFHVHFVSTSPNASVSEQFYEFKAAVEVTHTDPVEVHDENGDATLKFLPILAEKVIASVTQKEKATDEGYHKLFEAGAPRTKELILEELEKQVKLACSGVIKHVKDSQTNTGVKDAFTQFWIDDIISRFKEMRKAEPDRSVQDIQKELIQWTLDNRDKIYSPFLTTAGFDPTKDMPIEILHTILLGSSKQKQTYAIHLQSTNTDGLSIHAIRSNYIMQYAGSLIGCQFKTIAQINVFHVQDLVTDHEFMAWKAAGELAAFLWFPEIRNLEEYRRDLKVAVANVLDIFATIDPSKIIAKIKYHLLVHTDEDVVQFGPLIGVATEIFESFNGVFRYCSILSNHLAPSRDIALQLGDQEGLKHRITGGLWPSGEQYGKWCRAGSGVRGFLAQHPILQKLVGWTEEKLVKHGDFKLVSMKRGQKERDSVTLQSTTAANAVNYGLYAPDSTWKRCTFVISESLDECRVDSWVFAKSPTAEDPSTIPGRVSDILVDSRGVLVVLEQFQVLSSRDDIYGMPILVRPYDEVKFSIVPAKNLKFIFNVQHDCHSAKCEASGVRLRMQERVESDKTENYIVHGALDRFIINTHAFHNAHLLRATLPRALVAPIPLFPDRQAKHYELAAELREKLSNRKVAARSKKRKRGEKDVDEDDVGEPQRKKSRNGRKQRGNAALSGPQASSTSMVAGRPKRTIKRTERARATPEPDNDDEPEDINISEDSDEGYNDEESDGSD
ncbi:hypothetical protein C8J57DRAFT_1735527 [Mycena rebaudengoi]|nr:hypothetical protein C8J57DRAFT_1735527 [Mycena rebaudengoi]